MKNLTELNNIELLKKEKSTKIIAYILVGLLITSAIVSITNYIHNGYTVSSLLPVIILALVLPNFATLKSIKKEVKRRNLK